MTPARSCASSRRSGIHTRVSLDDDARAELSQLEAMHRLRVPRVVDGVHGARIAIDGVEVLDLASNDYLGLAGDPRIAEAAKRAIDETGVGAAASRLIVGNHRAHVALEHAIADWFGISSGGSRMSGAAIGVRTFGSGYAANVGVLTSLL